MFKRSIFAVVIILMCARIACAAHPLITDDAGTQGKGKFLFELNSQLGYSKNTTDEAGTSSTTKARDGEVKAALTYGAIDTVDLILGAPYQWKKTEVNDATTADFNGAADMSLEVKWRLYEKSGFSLAVKPGIIIPAGDKDKNLGAGRTGYTFYLISTKEIAPWTVNVNLGYKRNENRLEQREDIWHASLSTEYKAAKKLKLVTNTGVENNPDKSSNTNPAFVLGGLIYSISDSIDIDFGVKGGLNKAEKDYTFLAGIALRF